MDEDILVEDESGDKKYFTLAPNYILNHSTANDQALYMQMKRYAGEKGECYCSEKTLMKKLGIGRVALKKSLEYLLSRKWISRVGKREINTRGGKQMIDSYKVNDIWKMNIDHYEGGAVSATPGGAVLEGGAVSDAQGVVKNAQRGVVIADKEEHIEEEHIKKNISSDVKKFLNYFGEAWKREVGNGQPYFCNFGKDGQLVKQLLRVYSYEELSALADKFLRFDDEWVRDKGYTIGVFKSQISKLIANKQAKRDKSHCTMDKIMQTAAKMEAALGN